VGRVVIGMDPHKRSATIEIIDDRETVLAGGRFGTDRDGYRAMLAAGRRHPDRIWAVEGCAGIGKHLAQRLVVDGEIVVDVPAKLSARARVFSTGQGRKTDPVDALPACARLPSTTPRSRCSSRTCGRYRAGFSGGSGSSSSTRRSPSTTKRTSRR